MGKLAFETLASGYGLIEGPRVDAEDRLYFSDVQNGGVYRRSPDGSIETIVPRRRGVGGIALHADGGIVISGRDICHVRDGESRRLFARDDIPGFNDIFTDSDGRVFAGSMRSDPFRDSGPRTPGELWRIEAPGQVVELYGGVSLTNGIGLSPDGRRLYHSDTVPQHILVHELTADGRAVPLDPIDVSPGAPDGLAVDEAGCVWVALYGGGCVARYTPEGKLDRKLEVPASAVTSLCFGGRDLRDLYVVSADNSDDPERRGSVFRTRSDVAGLRAPLARV
jgi:gluconolactonase